MLDKLVSISVSSSALRLGPRQPYLRARLWISTLRFQLLRVAISVLAIETAPSQSWYMHHSAGMEWVFQCRPLFWISSSRILLSSTVPPFTHSFKHLLIYSFSKYLWIAYFMPNILATVGQGLCTGISPFLSRVHCLHALSGVSKQHRPFLASESSCSAQIKHFIFISFLLLLTTNP